MPEKWIVGGRKFFLAYSTLCFSTVLVALDMISDGSYVAIVLGTVGALITGNVVQDYRPPREGGKP